MSSPESTPTLQPGATYRFVVSSADEAVQTIRDRLGENARVLSVRPVKAKGFGGLLGRTKLEVVAQVAAAAEPNLSPFPPNSDTGTVAATENIQPAREASLSDRTADYASARAVAANVQRDVPTRLPELLKRAGFSEATLARLQALPAFAAQQEQPLHHAIAEVGRALRQLMQKRPVRPLPGRVAFLGTSGVGRTTALCKWLAREVFTKQKVVRVLKAEFDKPNPAEGLAVFCEALGVTLDYFAPGQEENGRTSAESVGSVYADLPGLSLRASDDNAAIAKFLDREKFTGRVLVLNASYDAALLRRAYAAGRDLGATHLVFTHLDELEHWGKLWDFLLEGELTPLFLATGPSLTGDCEENLIDAVLRRTLPGA
ncbi:MAG: flagellar GTP-binding protein [Nibricoccus sp.]